jgi:hypothetical protein
MSRIPPDPPKSSPIGGNVGGSRTGSRFEEFIRTLNSWPPFCCFNIEIINGEPNLSLEVVEKEVFRLSMYEMVDNMIARDLLEPEYRADARAAIDNEIDTRMERSRSTQ